MAKKIAARSDSSIIFRLIGYVKIFINCITCCFLSCPVFCMFICTSISIMYLILSNPKVQQKLASLPFERFIARCKSQKMITVYTTMMEVFLELLLAVVLGGVSVVITLWVAFEEMGDKKYSNLIFDAKKSASGTELQK